MDYRTGKCSQCGAEYKVPASFQHSAARCKVCKGVVHLGPARPAAGAAPAPAAAGPAAIPAKKVVPKPAAPQAARPSAPATPAPRPAEPQRPARGPGGIPRPPARGGTLERLKGERAPEAETPPPSTVERSEERPAARKGREHRGHSGREKKPPVAGILTGVGLVLVAALAYLFRGALFGTSKPAGAASAEAPPTAPANAAPAPLGEATREPLEAAAAPEEPKAPEAKAPPPPKDPATVDLASIPDFGPTVDTTPEEWSRMNEWGALWMDVEAGAAGNRAKIDLLKMGRKAVPVILNLFKKLDFATKEGRSNGDQCQKAMQQVTNGRNFDWRYADEAAGRGFDNPEDVYFNKRVVEEWVKVWRQVEVSIEAWIKLAKLEEKDPAEMLRLREAFGSKPETAGDAPAADDLDVD
jgi:hypothetical protein